MVRGVAGRGAGDVAGGSDTDGDGSGSVSCWASGIGGDEPACIGRGGSWTLRGASRRT
ncbi:hypothetical protein AGRA3207_002255 [Actinomadura graeca]|uniref:Uncharacterized protein n=1 Tax=Actinomadura graeca TaxID=2750812 RepID=A0ABX8QRU5_9ACTN|nr:hypothetical protein [Actinomadura graeca]QXJ21405.1 hypothetical protein AGRA3207_002255 [Actinomadura graeca]